MRTIKNVAKFHNDNHMNAYIKVMLGFVCLDLVGLVAGLFNLDKNLKNNGCNYGRLRYCGIPRCCV